MTRSKPVCSRWPRMNSPMIRRAMRGIDEQLLGQRVGARRRSLSCVLVAHAGLLADQPLELAEARTPAARRAAAAAPSAHGARASRSISTTCRPGSSSGASKTTSPLGIDDLRAAPEGDRFLDPDAIDEDDERRRQLGIGAHQRPPRGGRAQPALDQRGHVAAGRGRDVDQDLGAVERQQVGHRQVPEVLADAEPEAHSEARVDGAQLVAGAEEAALVEQAVVGQVRLAVDVADVGRPRAARRRCRAARRPSARRSRRRRSCRRRRAPAPASRGSSRRMATSAFRSCSR